MATKRFEDVTLTIEGEQLIITVNWEQVLKAREAWSEATEQPAQTAAHDALIDLGYEIGDALDRAALEAQRLVWSVLNLPRSMWEDTSMMIRYERRAT